MQGLPNESLNLVAEFLGEPDSVTLTVRSFVVLGSGAGFLPSTVAYPRTLRETKYGRDNPPWHPSPLNDDYL